MAEEARAYQIDASKPYPFVPTAEEHHRLETQSSSLNEAMFNNPIRSPLKSPTKILDLGCGTGHQTALLAKKYPTAHIIGVDKSPVPDLRPKADDITYILGDFHELCGTHELLQAGTFDLIYQRMLVLAIPDWPKHLASMKSLLKPGGYIECQEMSLWELYDRNENYISRDWTFLDVSTRRGQSHGYIVSIAPRLAGLLEQAGFEDVELEKFRLPFRGDWAEHPETEKVGRYMNWATRPMFRQLFVSGAKEGEDAEAMVKEFEAKTVDGDVGVHGHFMVARGRKS